MVSRPGNGNKLHKSGGMGGWKLALTIIGVVVASAAISWGMLSYYATPKSEAQSEITKINNTVGHIKDMTTGLDNFAGNQNTKIDNLTDDTQSRFDVTDKQIGDANSKIDKTQSDLAGVKSEADNLTAQTSQLSSQLSGVSQRVTAAQTEADTLTTAVNTVNTNISTVNTNINTLTTAVNGIVGGLQITPTVTSSSTNGGTGYISLSINSSIAQTLAFKVEFRPTVDLALNNSTYEGLLKALYTSATTPVNLYETSSSGTAVRGDYVVYYNTSDTKFHVGEIVFITQETSLSAGATSETLYFTYATGTAPSFEVLITPEHEASSTTTGASPSTW